MAAIVWDGGAAPGVRRPRQHDPRVQLVTAPPSRRRPGPGVYRRRRLVAVAVLLVMLAVAVQGATGLLRGSATAGTAPTPPVVLVADAGDTYWSLAARVHDGGDIRSTVDELVAANGGRDLRPGDRIVLR
jgi:hypothetical protein